MTDPIFLGLLNKEKKYIEKDLTEKWKKETNEEELQAQSEGSFVVLHFKPAQRFL